MVENDGGVPKRFIPDGRRTTTMRRVVGRDPTNTPQAVAD